MPSNLPSPAQAARAKRCLSSERGRHPGNPITNDETPQDGLVRPCLKPSSKAPSKEDGAEADKELDSALEGVDRLLYAGP